MSKIEHRFISFLSILFSFVAIVGIIAGILSIRAIEDLKIAALYTFFIFTLASIAGRVLIIALSFHYSMVKRNYHTMMITTILNLLGVLSGLVGFIRYSIPLEYMNLIISILAILFNFVIILGIDRKLSISFLLESYAFDDSELDIDHE